MQSERGSSTQTAVSGFLLAMTGVAAALYLLQPHKIWVLVGVVAGLGAVVMAVLAVGDPWLRLLFAFVTACLVGILLGSAAASPRHAGSASYAARLTVLFRQLERGRSTSYGQLADASGNRSRARIAKHLRAIFRSHARTLAGFRPPPRDRSAAQRISACLTSLAHDYSLLARAVTDPHGSQADLNHARRRIRIAGRGLIHAERALASHGYEIDGLGK